MIAGQRHFGQKFFLELKSDKMKEKEKIQAFKLRNYPKPKAHPKVTFKTMNQPMKPVKTF